jgi:hypothetical protein
MVPTAIGYAKSGDVSIAYQVVGDGRLPLVLVPERGREPQRARPRATPALPGIRLRPRRGYRSCTARTVAGSTSWNLVPIDVTPQ